MPPGSGNGDRTLGHLLAAHVAEVDVVAAVFVEQLVNATRLRFDIDVAAEKSRPLGSGYRRQSPPTPSTHRGFRRVGRRHHDSADPFEFRRSHGHREHPFYRSHGTVERQLTDHRVFAQSLRANLPAAG